MSSSTAGKHAGSSAASNQPAAAEPTFAERARTLVYLGRVGSLSTLSRKQQGFPFGSVMPYGLDDHANPVFLISTMAMHTQNVQADPRSSLLVTQPDTAGDPLGAARVTLLGNILSVSVSEVAEARKLYLARHANSKYWVDFDDFSFYRMDVVDVYFVGGFGVMGWVSASEYYGGQPDPLADTATEIIQHMNTDHREALVLLARAFAGIESSGSGDDFGRPSRLSRTLENARWHTRCPHRILAGGEQSGGSQKSASRNGRASTTNMSNRVANPRHLH